MPATKRVKAAELREIRREYERGKMESKIIFREKLLEYTLEDLKQKFLGWKQYGISRTGLAWWAGRYRGKWECMKGKI